MNNKNNAHKCIPVLLHWIAQIYYLQELWHTTQTRTNSSYLADHHHFGPKELVPKERAHHRRFAAPQAHRSGRGAAVVNHRADVAKKCA